MGRVSEPGASSRLPSRESMGRLPGQAGVRRRESRDWTNMEHATPTAAGQLFPETSWTTLLQARDVDPEIAFAALSRLAERYRPAFRQFLLQLGCPAGEVDDVLQDFFAQRFLRETFLAGAAPGHGLFRTFLRTCLRNFLISHHRRASHRANWVSLSDLEQIGEDPAGVETSVAGRLLDRLWARQLIANARARLRAEADAAGRGALCEALESVLEEKPGAPGYPAIAGRLGMTANAVGVAAHRFRERLRWLIQDEVRQTVREPADWRQELQILVQALQE